MLKTMASTRWRRPSTGFSGSDTEIDQDALNDIDNYVIPTSTPSGTSRNPEVIREQIATTSIALQKLFEQEANDNDDSDSAVSILEGQSDGFQIADLDAQTQTDAADAITEARERASASRWPIRRLPTTRSMRTRLHRLRKPSSASATRRAIPAACAANSPA